jgi:hypothetical protein
MTSINMWSAGSEYNFYTYLQINFISGKTAAESIERLGLSSGGSILELKSSLKFEFPRYI